METSSETYHRGDLRITLGVEQPPVSCTTVSKASALATVGEIRYVGKVAKEASSSRPARGLGHVQPASLQLFSDELSCSSGTPVSVGAGIVFHSAAKRQPGSAKC